MTFMQQGNALKSLGNELFKEGNYAAALEKYIGAMGEEPGEPTLYTNAANCHFKLGQFERAIELADRALSLNPSMTKAVYRRGLCYGELGMHKKAVEDLRRVVKAVPGELEAKRKLDEHEKALHRAIFSQAIKKDEIELEWKCIEKMDVDPSYAGPKIANNCIDIRFAEALIAWFTAENKLPFRLVYEIMLLAKQTLEKEPNLVNISLDDGQKLTICGDIHGQFFDLARIFTINGMPSKDHIYLFNGDFVDRGANSVEVILTLLSLKCAMPGSFFMSRGNHESESVNRIYGFYEELSRKYDAKMHGLFAKVLNCLPLAYVVNDSWFVVHGGLPEKDGFLLSDLQGLNRFCTPETGSLMAQLLWSDPQDAQGISPSHRGEGVLFGPDITEAFLARNGLSRLIRSHVWEPTGYKVEHQGRCVTIFSAPNYTGTPSSAAFINTDHTLKLDFVQFDAAQYQGKSARPRPAMPMMF